MPYLVGITGASGCGKSTALDVLRGSGYRVMDLDTYAVQVIREAGSPVVTRLEQILGIPVTDRGVIDFKMIGTYFDHHRDEEVRFEAWFQDYVGKRIRVALARLQGGGVIFADAPFMRQRNLTGAFDMIWLITADPAACESRLRLRNGYDDEKIRYLIERSAVSEAIYQKPVMAIANNGSMEEYRHSVLVAAAAVSANWLPYWQE